MSSQASRAQGPKCVKQSWSKKCHNRQWLCFDSVLHVLGTQGWEAPRLVFRLHFWVGGVDFGLANMFCNPVSSYFQDAELKNVLTTPTPHISKNMLPKYAMKWGVVWRKNPLKERDFHREYVVQTPTFMAYKLRLLWHTNPDFIGGGGGLQLVDEWLVVDSHWRTLRQGRDFGSKRRSVESMSRQNSQPPQTMQADDLHLEPSRCW